MNYNLQIYTELLNNNRSENKNINRDTFIPDPNIYAAGKTITYCAMTADQYDQQYYPDIAKFSGQNDPAYILALSDAEKKYGKKGSFQPVHTDDVKAAFDAWSQFIPLHFQAVSEIAPNPHREFRYHNFILWGLEIKIQKIT